MLCELLVSGFFFLSLIFSRFIHAETWSRFIHTVACSKSSFFGMDVPYPTSCINTVCCAQPLKDILAVFPLGYKLCYC